MTNKTEFKEGSVTVPYAEILGGVVTGQRSTITPYEAAMCLSAIEHLRRSLSEGARTCEWTPCYEEDKPEEADYLQSGCGKEWMGTDDGDPAGRWMKFCPFCGGKVVFMPQHEEAPE